MDPNRVDKDQVATERVLRALDAVQPAPGLEDRLLQRLAQQAQYSRQPARRFGLAARGVSAGAGCAVAVLVVLLSLHLGSKRSALFHHMGTVGSSPASSGPVAAHSAGRLPKVAIETAREHRPLHFAGPVSVVHARQQIVPVPSPVNREDGNDVAALPALDRQALDDLHAESSPPPPLPLTAQERMVKLMLRRGEKHDLAQLDPAQNVRLTDAERRSFQSFFDPEPTPELALELKKGNLR